MADFSQRGFLLMDLDDALLVQKSKEGDIKAFEKLFLKYQSKVYNFTLRMVQNREDAEELTQESFAKAYVSIKGLKENDAFKGWLMRIAVNTIRDKIKSGREKNWLCSEIKTGSDEDKRKNEIPDSSWNGEKEVLDKELKQITIDALSSLAGIHREVILLHHFESMRVEEIAKILKLSEGTVKSRLARGRELLVKKLKPYLK